MIYAIMLWFLSGLLGWWIIVRYLDKQLDMISFINLPMIIGGPITLIVSLIEYFGIEDKIFKKWKD